LRGPAAALCSLWLLTGCGLWNSTRNTAGDAVLNTQLAAGSASYVDRCIDMMKRAYPDAHFEITGKRLGNGPSMAMATVEVQARRNDVPAGGKTPREVAVQCRFDSGVIVDFHWTASPLE
jgi:hypothetical protein